MTQISKGRSWELLALNEKKVSLRAMVRQYVEEMGAVQEEVRGILKPSVERWEKSEQAAIKQFELEFGNKKVGLALAKIPDARKVRKRGLLKVLP